jgi:hypothetical protein
MPAQEPVRGTPTSADPARKFPGLSEHKTGHPGRERRGFCIEQRSRAAAWRAPTGVVAGIRDEHSDRTSLATTPTPGLRVARCAASLIPIVRRAEHRRLVRSSGVRRIPEIPRIA